MDAGRTTGWRRAVAAALLALAAGLAVAGPGGPAGAASRPAIGDGTGGVGKRLIGDFASPVYVTAAPGARGIVYVVEQRGTVQAVDHGTVAPQPFLDLQGVVNDDGNERGLLSIAFDPAYRQNGRLYAYFTNAAGNVEVDELNATSDLDANEASRRKVIEIPHQTGATHNGGQLAFGRDGYLYLAPGDGGCCGDPLENAQNRHVLLGKLLRIDPRAAGGYGVPRGNPFVGRPGKDEIYALGLRNPFRFSFDRSRIAIGDVGQDTWEEVDYESRRSIRGANFGWDHFEGDHLFDYPGDDEAPRPRHRYQPPVFEYPHQANGGGHREGCAVIGGYVVRDADLRSLYGRYLYADLCAGDLRSFVPRLGGAGRAPKLGVHVDTPSTFGEGRHGRIYVASRNGPVYRLVRR
jgi:glucose/arabinose dehydrogenase